MLLPLQKAEMDRSRDVDMAEVDDPRVDLCLFCLPPHRLRPVDVRYMAELGKVVPILPIVTKADTMSTAEAAKYRREVYNRLQSPGVPGSKGEGTGRRCWKARGVPGLPDASPAAPPMDECNMAELAKALKNPWRARSDKSGLFRVSCIHLATDLVGAQQQRVALPRLCLRRAELRMAEETRGPQQNMWMATIGTNDCCLSASEDTNASGFKYSLCAAALSGCMLLLADTCLADMCFVGCTSGIGPSTSYCGPAGRTSAVYAAE